MNKFERGLHNLREHTSSPCTLPYLVRKTLEFILKYLYYLWIYYKVSVIRQEIIIIGYPRTNDNCDKLNHHR